MKKLFLLFFTVIVCHNVSFPCNELQGWRGDWKEHVGSDRSLICKLPFYSDYCDDIIIIHNENPNRPIVYKILDENGSILISGNVTKENSSQITISVSNLPDNGYYTIILTSPNPNDRVWSQFEK